MVHDAVKAGELPAAPLRMLIDRVQTNKTGKQVFGSQVGVPLLPEAKRERIEKQYGIDQGAAAGARESFKAWSTKRFIEHPL